MYITYEYTENEYLERLLAINQISNLSSSRKNESKKLDCMEGGV